MSSWVSTVTLKLRQLAILAAAILAVGTLADYVVGVRSSAFSFAQTALRESHALQARVGTVSEVNLRKFWGFSQKSGYGNSTASLTVTVVGERGSEYATLSLRQVNGQWTLVKASIPL